MIIEMLHVGAVMFCVLVMYGYFVRLMMRESI